MVHLGLFTNVCDPTFLYILKWEIQMSYLSQTFLYEEGKIMINVRPNSQSFMRNKKFKFLTRKNI